LQEKAKKINKSFIEYKIGRSSLERSKAEVLKAMCRSRGLDDRGTKEDMVVRLTDWVGSGLSRDWYTC